MVDHLPISYEQLREVHQALKGLPRTRDLVCTGCGATTTYVVLRTYVSCSACDTRHKVRSLSAELELQDLIEVVLAWVGEAAERDEVLAAHDAAGGSKTDWDE